MKKALFFAFSWMLVGLLQAGPFSHLIDGKKQAFPQPTEEELLNESQISYRAEGGFTGVESYGVIISCVKGKISVLKSIYDPRLDKNNAQMRQIASMDENEYLQLWADMNRQALLKMNDSTPVTMDITDEFTNHFVAKVGKHIHRFEVVGISRPESSKYFALRERIDHSVNMKALWATHERLARNFDDGDLTQNLQ